MPVALVDDLTFYAGVDLQRWIYVLQGVFLTTSSLWTQQEPFAKKNDRAVSAEICTKVLYPKYYNMLWQLKLIANV